MCVVSISLGGSGLAAAGLPIDPRFDQVVTLELAPRGVSLETVLRALTSSVGLKLVAEGLPQKVLTNPIAASPFRQVFELLLALNKLEFELLAGDLIVVGPKEVVDRLHRPLPAAVTPVAAPLERRTYVLNGVQDAVAQIVALIKAEFAGTSVIPVLAARSIVVGATVAQHEEIAQLIAELNMTQVDSSPHSGSESGFDSGLSVPSTVSRVFRLSNQKASELAKVLSEVVRTSLLVVPDATRDLGLLNPLAVLSAPGNFSGESTKAQSPQVGTAPQLPSGEREPMRQPVTITADDRSNTLIITGTQPWVDRLEELIPQLDERQALVRIGVRIEEIDDDTGRNLGIDWSFGLGSFAAKLLPQAGSGLGLVFDATKSLASLNLGATLNALEMQNLSRKINDTSITVLNNGMGELRSGGRIEIQNLNQGSTAAQVASRTLNFGVHISASPRVAADGTINLDIQADLSDVLNPNDLNATRISFSDQSSRSSVQMRDGDSLVLGSLLATTRDERVNGVPLLSWIPLIGELFKSTATTDRKRQLLIILTVHVLS